LWCRTQSFCAPIRLSNEKVQVRSTLSIADIVRPPSHARFVPTAEVAALGARGGRKARRRAFPIQLRKPSERGVQSLASRCLTRIEVKSRNLPHASKTTTATLTDTQARPFGNFAALSRARLAAPRRFGASVQRQRTVLPLNIPFAGSVGSILPLSSRGSV
jgi:hypothetical protein